MFCTYLWIRFLPFNGASLLTFNGVSGFSFRATFCVVYGESWLGCLRVFLAGVESRRLEASNTSFRRWAFMPKTISSPIGSVLSSYIVRRLHHFLVSLSGYVASSTVMVCVSLGKNRILSSSTLRISDQDQESSVLSASSQPSLRSSYFFPEFGCDPVLFMFLYYWFCFLSVNFRGLKPLVLLDQICSGQYLFGKFHRQVQDLKDYQNLVLSEFVYFVIRYCFLRQVLDFFGNLQLRPRVNDFSVFCDPSFNFVLMGYYQKMFYRAGSISPINSPACIRVLPLLLPLLFDSPDAVFGFWLRNSGYKILVTVWILVLPLVCYCFFIYLSCRSWEELELSNLLNSFPLNDGYNNVM